MLSCSGIKGLWLESDTRGLSYKNFGNSNDMGTGLLRPCAESMITVMNWATDSMMTMVAAVVFGNLVATNWVFRLQDVSRMSWGVNAPSSQAPYPADVSLRPKSPFFD
jgi:hypothetical protein